MLDLATWQRRFAAIVTGAAPLDGADGLVRGDGVAPAARMHVYVHAYRARLHAALAAEYPKLAGWLGSDAFARLLDAYLAHHPPRHPSLRDAGVDLPRHLAMTGPSWLADLAQLERARTCAFDGADAPPLSRAHVAALPPEAFPVLPLRLIPTATLLALGSNADDVWAALEDDATLPGVHATSRMVVVWRRDVTVVHRAVPADEAGALARIARGDATFADVCEALADGPSPVERALTLVLGWLDGALLAA